MDIFPLNITHLRFNCQWQFATLGGYTYKCIVYIYVSYTCNHVIYYLNLNVFEYFNLFFNYKILTIIILK